MPRKKCAARLRFGESCVETLADWRGEAGSVSRSGFTTDLLAIRDDFGRKRGGFHWDREFYGRERERNRRVRESEVAVAGGGCDPEAVRRGRHVLVA